MSCFKDIGVQFHTNNPCTHNDFLSMDGIVITGPIQTAFLRPICADCLMSPSSVRSMFILSCWES